MELIDTHCHLAMYPLAAAAERALQEAAAVGVRTVITAAVSVADWQSLGAQLTLPGLHAVMGVHPQEVSTADVGDLRALREGLSRWLEREGVVGVGEVGLDAGEGQPALARQLEVLRPQLELAQQHELPVVLHCHRAHEALLQLLQSVGRSWRGVVHGFVRGPELARRYLARGLCIGVGGRLLDPRAVKLRRTACELPLERLLLETDSPSAAWGDRPRGTSRPADLPDVAAALAALRGLPVEDVAAVTTRVACEHFRLPRAVPQTGAP